MSDSDADLKVRQEPIMTLSDKIGTAPAWERYDERKDAHNLLEWLDQDKARILHLRRFLILKGIPETAVYAAKPVILARAYRDAAYLAAWKNKLEIKPTRSGSFRKAVDLTLDTGDDFAAAMEADSKPLTKSEAPASIETDGPPTKIDAAAIARAADAVLTTKLREAEDRLSQRVSRELANASTTLNRAFSQQVEALRVPESEIKKILDTATQLAETVALRIIRENVPQRLEITYNGIARSLPAEPRHSAFDELFRWLSTGTHVAMVGPKGSGKTHLFKQLATALGYDLDTEFFPVDQALTKYDVKGFKNPIGDYVQTLVYKAVKNGGLLVIDEADMWAASALGALNSILANDFGTFTDEIITVHPKFLCVLAMNTYGQGADRQYIGRNPLDAASLDRFAFVEIDYDPAMEKQIYGDTPWLHYVHKVRAAAKQLGMTNMVPSMRAIAKGQKGYAVGLPPDKIAFGSLWTGAAPDIIAKITNVAGQPPARAPVEMELPETEGELDADLLAVRHAVTKNQMIEAIKVLRTWHEKFFGDTMRLKVAKDRIEAYRDGHKTLPDIFVEDFGLSEAESVSA